MLCYIHKCLDRANREALTENPFIESGGTNADICYGDVRHCPKTIIELLNQFFFMRQDEESPIGLEPIPIDKAAQRHRLACPHYRLQQHNGFCFQVLMDYIESVYLVWA